MTVRRLAAIVLIFFGASLAWATLGSSPLARAGSFDTRLEREVELQATARVSWDEVFAARQQAARVEAGHAAHP